MVDHLRQAFAAFSQKEADLKRIPPTFPVYAVGNIALIVLGSETVTARAFPHWAVWLSAIIPALLLAFQASRTLARAYDREDRTFEMFTRLLPR